METFALQFERALLEMRNSPVNIECRGRQMAYELQNAKMRVPTEDGVSVYSHKSTRAFPIKFALAEFAWILAGRNDVASIARFNKNIVHYSDDTIIMGGAYGERLGGQIYSMIRRISNDKHTRQACAVIWNANDSSESSKDHPCNVFLQFMIRNDRLNLTVTSRSSDLMTGLPIDTFHWQFLLHIVRNELLPVYPELKVGHVIYNLTSLHVYDVDRQALENITDVHFDDEDSSMYHNIEINQLMTYSWLEFACRKLFDSCESLQDITGMFGFSAPAADKIVSLHDMFINRVHKFVRKGDKA